MAVHGRKMAVFGGFWRFTGGLRARRGRPNGGRLAGWGGIWRGPAGFCASGIVVTIAFIKIIRHIAGVRTVGGALGGPLVAQATGVQQRQARFANSGAVGQGLASLGECDQGGDHGLGVGFVQARVQRPQLADPFGHLRCQSQPAGVTIARRESGILISVVEQGALGAGLGEGFVAGVLQKRHGWARGEDVVMGDRRDESCIMQYFAAKVKREPDASPNHLDPRASVPGSIGRGPAMAVRPHGHPATRAQWMADTNGRP